MDGPVSANPNAGASGVTGIVAALPEEVAPLRPRLRDERRIGGRLALSCGRLGNVPVAIGVTGDGPWHARRGLEALFGALDVRRLLVVGVSGALSHDLGPGDLLVGERLLEEGAPGELRPLEALVAHAERATGARRGVLVSARHIADTAAEKRRLLQASQSKGPAAVDLESHAYARTADAARVPWLCVRSISDAADEALPPLLELSRDARGGVNRGRVALGMLREPSVVPTLWRLKRRLEHSALLLARAVESLLAAGPFPESSFPDRAEDERAQHRVAWHRTTEL
jgi:nucleoside phosphorylase